MGLEGAEWVKNLSVGICNGAPWTAHSSFYCLCLSSAVFFSKSTVSKISFKNTIRVSNSLGLDQAQHFVGPDLGPNCLQGLSADGTSSERVVSTLNSFDFLSRSSSPQFKSE